MARIPYFTHCFVTFILSLFLGLLPATAQSLPDALRYEINLNTTGIFNTGLQANTKIFLKKAKSSPNIQIQLLGFTVDSVLVNDSLNASFNKLTETLEVLVPAPADTLDSLSVQIFYHGVPQKDDTWGGFYTNGTYAFNMGVGFSSSPHNFGRAWFPCFDNFTDRALYSFNVLTPPGYTAVCGGLLTFDTLDQLGNHLWRWELHQPIPTYLAGVAVGKYTFVKYEFTGKSATIPIWLAAEAKDTASLKISFTNLNSALTCFEERFGPYLFDRVGYVGVPFNSGAMEHASNIAYPLYAITNNQTYETLMAHELSHHWWGNLATCADEGEMWLNEGWASYCEALFLECLYGQNALVKDIESKRIDVLVNGPVDDNGYLAVKGIPHEHTYGTHVYKKGALMAHSLRKLMGDSAFFAACRSYLSKHQFTSVTSIELRNEFQQFTSSNLTTFFEQYVFRKGHYDIVPTPGTPPFEPVKNFQLHLYELNRYKTSKHVSQKVDVLIYFTDFTSLRTTVEMNNGDGFLDIDIPAGKQYLFAVVDPDHDHALGYTAETAMIKTKGLKNFSNELFSLNVQTISDSFPLHVQHHWVGATQGDLRNAGIRLSQERYWSIRGNFPANMTAWGFFSYDGTAEKHLDEELFGYAETEDSLVLMYRENENASWKIITQNITYQPGGNPTDNMGRFWITKLLPGDYALGLRDQRVVGLNVSEPSLHLSVVPNPAQVTARVYLPEGQAYNKSRVAVYDMQGRCIDTIYCNKGQAYTDLHMGEWKNGIYLIVVSIDGVEHTARLIKE